jgi:hypothetical protein
LIDVLRAQGRWHFRGLIAGDETRLYLDMKAGTISLSADAELPVCVKRIITNEKRMLIVFWGIHGIAYHYCLPKDRTLDSGIFCEELSSPLPQKIQPDSKKLANS